MPRRHAAACTAAFLALASAAGTVTAPAGAGDSRVAQCLEAAEHAQELRNAGKLRESRTQLAACMAQGCPASVRSDCKGWDAAAERAIPTVVLAAHDPQGKPVTDVRVSIDGAPLVSSLDGRPVAVDPGSHVLRFEAAAGGEPVEQKVDLPEGTRDKRVEVQVGVAAAAATETATPTASTTASEEPTATPAGAGRKVPVAVWVLGGAGVAAEVVFAIFLSQGYSVANDLTNNKHCPPGCPSGDVDAMSRDFVVADVALYTGIGLLGAAAAVYLLRPSAAPSGQNVGVHVHALRGGAALGVGGVF